MSRRLRRVLIAFAVVDVTLLVVVVAVLALGGSGGCGDGYPQSPECVAEAFVTRTGGSA